MGMARIKVGVVGAGYVGATTALALAKRDFCDVVLSDIIEGMPLGKGLDLRHSRLLEYYDAQVFGTNTIEDMKDCPIVVITAGVPRKPGMSREDLITVNAKIIKDVCEQIKKYCKEPILIVVTNPLDTMTYAALKITGYSRYRVFGMAGALDCSRMAHYIAEKLNVSVKDVQAMVLGSHGKQMVAVPRYATVSGIPVTELLSQSDIDEICKKTIEAGTTIVNYLKTGSAYYSPASAVAVIVEAIVKDLNRIIPCATYLDGEYGFKDVVMGVPVKLGENGIKQIIELKLTEQEKAGFNKAVEALRGQIEELKRLVSL
jgi:malate dehydrogenase